MIRTGATLLCLAMAPAPATAQVGCLPPEEPFAYEPPDDDPELRALIDEQYQAYINGTESYLNCLNDEAVRARAEFQTILNRYLRYFGDEAGVEFDVPG
ncbi:hypothetical protein LX81_03019 [Palleronia aestuarii]|uniref:Uncharacterized protein n=1 Tax=Palleronia aestuarii TaxID=568105 RepID=A0A2W7N2D8_9RHOB|nr:hypothetical protein [Palleronia aestuarii]PZX14220.1 hypothetical protein LX81_03019 [Palleronia aestuarii]